MELVGVMAPGGDEDEALDGIVQEYLLLGWSAAQIMFLFRSPTYAATHRIFERKGAAYVKDRVQSLADQWSQGWIGRGDKHDA